jgi:thiamine pyrophosphokinase
VTDTRPAVIVAGGDAVPSGVAALLPRSGFVIAADSGLHVAHDLGLTVDLVVGDLDSADADRVDAAVRAGAHLERHPADKDATDLELALEAALTRGLGPAVVVGGASFDRIDHFMANALLMAADRFAPLEPTWLVKGAEVHVVRGVTTLRGTSGDIVTLLPVGGPADGIRTSGLRWPLAGDTLLPGSTRGVSNQLVQTSATIEVTTGVLLVIHGGPPS